MTYPIILSQGWSKLADEVDAEIKRARKKFPGCDNMTLAMAEEAGELVRAVLSRWHAIRSFPASNPYDVELREAIRKEAVQTMAMCVRLILEGDPMQMLPPSGE